MVGAFIEHEGAFFKRKPKGKGGYLRVVYCPNCKRSAFSLMNKLTFYCTRCDWTANFTGRQLDSLMEGLPDAPAA